MVDYLNELTKALTHIVRPAYGHIDNNHEGLTREQTTDLIRVGDEVEAIYRRINAMLTTNDFGDIDLVLSMRDRLFETISDAIKSELRRFNTSGKGSTKASMLYLTILNETRTMVLQPAQPVEGAAPLPRNEGRHQELALLRQISEIISYLRLTPQILRSRQNANEFAFCPR